MTPRRTSRALSAVAFVAAAFVLLPLAGLAVRMPWSDAWSLMSSVPVRRAAWVSVSTSLTAAVLSVLLGVPLAWWLARSGSRLVGPVRSAVITPMVMPPVVAGIALLTVFGRRGVLGRFLLDWWGVSIPFTRTAVVMAQLLVAMPFLVVAAESAFRQLDTGLEDAARTLGAGPWTVFSRVALPGARAAVGAGAALAWARSLGEFGATITFAGSFPGRTQTLPMSVYELVSTDYRLSLVLSFVMMAVAVAVIAALRGRWVAAR